MIKIKNTKIYGLEESVIRSGYPKRYGEPEDFSILEKSNYVTNMDMDRVFKLSNVPSGSGHDNFLKGIIVQFDLCYPQYFTPQLQRYSFIDIVSSQSKMHTLIERKNIKEFCNEHVDDIIIDICNKYIDLYNSTEDKIVKQYYFNKLISNLPMGFMLWMGISTNYLQLKTIYNQRKNHRLEEWKTFCKWIKSLPDSKLIIGDK